MKNFGKITKHIRYVDKWARSPLWAQILWAFVISFFFLMVMWMFWCVGAYVSRTGHFPMIGGNEPMVIEPLYDMFAYGTNPPNSSEIGVGKQVGVVFLYLVASALITGLLITTFVNWFDQRKEKWQTGEIDYDIRSNFVLIIGGHQMVPQLCKDLLARNDGKRMIIQTIRSAESLRKDIQSKIGIDAAEEVFIYTGNRTSSIDLKLVNPEYADEIFIIGEDNEYDKNEHDAYSMQCLTIINGFFDKSDITAELSRVRCHVMFQYQASTKIFQYTDLLLNSRIDFVPFNFYEKWAEQVLVCGDGYEPLIGSNPSDFYDSDKRVHLIIFGMSKMGTMLAAKAAHLCHFPNFHVNGKHPRTLITFIDSKAATEMDFFRGRNSSLLELSRWRFVNIADYMDSKYVDSGKPIYCSDGVGPGWVDPMRSGSEYADANIDPDLMDIDWEFIQGDVANSVVRRYLIDAVRDSRSVTTIAVCIPGTHNSVSASMFLPEVVYSSPNLIQILVQQDATGAIVEAVSKGGVAAEFRNLYSENYGLRVASFSKLKAFGMLDSCRYVGNNDFLPMAINYIYSRVYDIYTTNPQAGFDKLAEDLLLALTQRDSTVRREVEEYYDAISNVNGKSIQAQRWSNVYNADSVRLKTAVLNAVRHCDERPLRIDEDAMLIEVLAKVEHSRWILEQMFVGYRPVKPTDQPVYHNVINVIKNRYISKKEDLKLQHIHPDIRSYDRTEYDPGLEEGTKDYDRALSIMLPVLAQMINNK